MTCNQVEHMWVCQLGKPENRKKLKEYVDNSDSSKEELVRYYRDFISMLINTPAWGVNGVNKVVNELRAAVVATLTDANSGKTTAWAHAKKMIRQIDYHSTRQVKPYYNRRYKLVAPLTDEELLQLLLNKE